MLIGRDTENKFLEHYFSETGSQIIVLYGQKGVGKTTLLKHFAEGKDFVYYQARACSEREQCYQWASELTEKGHSIGKYPSYTQIFQSILSDPSSHKKVLMIDEFHYMIKTNENFLRELITFIKEEDTSVFVVLASSASGWIENSMISKIGNLATSLSGLLKIREYKFSDMRKMFPGFSPKDSMEIYAILGGLPGLWKSFSEKQSGQENIIQNILCKESRLFDYLAIFMAEELREPAVYNTILASLAKGNTKLNDIYAHTGFSRAKISVYLKNLMELDLVEKVSSYESDGYENTQKGLYRIANSYVRFYFRYLFSNQSLLQTLTPQEFYNEIIRDTYADFAEEAYRCICKEQLQKRFTFVGEWVGKTGNIDIIARDMEGKITCGACSYAKEMSYEDYEWLIFQIKQAKLSDYKILLYCEQGFDQKLKKLEAEGTIILNTFLDE